jgi:hypothetical protein
VAPEPIGDDNPIEEILLTGFPNPERKGCPPPEVIDALGNRKLGRDDPAWRHIWSCSPCFTDFKAIRDARVARIERADKQAKTRRQFIVAAAATASVAAAGYFLVADVRSKPPRGVSVITIDLTNAGAVRGSAPTGDAPVAQLPRKLDEIHLTLPTFSRRGRYSVAILESRSESTAVALSSAIARGTEANPTILITLDLSEAKPGPYFLGIRLEEEGQQGIASYYPVVVIPD